MYYTIDRRFERHTPYQCIITPAGEVLKHYGDSQLREAETMLAMLNAAFSEGAKSRTEALNAAHAETDALTAKVLALQFELGRAEALLRRHGIEGEDARDKRVSQRDAPGHHAICAAVAAVEAEAAAGPFYVVIDHEQTAAECSTLEAARTEGRKLADAEAIPCTFSIQDSNGQHVEDISRTDGRTLGELVQAFDAAHPKRA